MTNVEARCDGIFIGHAIASNYDPSIFMAVNISDSLLQYQQFNGSDIFSRYMNMYHTQPCEVGETTKYIYQAALKKIQSSKATSSLPCQDFLFDQSIINDIVKLTDKQLDGHTAGCSPAQRSFPLAVCSEFTDDDLFEVSKQEAALTHYSPLAGQVSGVINIICRSLLQNKGWNRAVESAFSMPRLHADVIDVYRRYCRSSHPFVKTHPAYAPTVLNAALHYVQNSRSAAEAIETARANDKHYCAPIVGILSGARWGIPLEMYQDRNNDPQLKTIRDTAYKLSSLWTLHPDRVTA